MRLGILAILMLVSALIGLAELGVATIFDMKFEGMSYLEYTHAFYSVPWHTVVAGIIVFMIFTICTESIYRNLKKVMEK
jgi:hypothetical protein